MGLVDYGDNIWGPPELTQEELEDVKLRKLKIQEDMRELSKIQARMKREKDQEYELLEIFRALNDSGRQAAIKQLQLLIKVREYTKIWNSDGNMDTSESKSALHPLSSEKGDSTPEE